jgi:hypothetical protein
MYWTKETEAWFLKYITSRDSDLFEQHLYRPIRCIAEVYITKCLMPISNEEKAVITNELIGHLIINLHHYNAKKGKAFSWISIIFKHYVWNMLKDKRRENQHFLAAEDMPRNDVTSQEHLINSLEQPPKDDTVTYTDAEIRKLSKLVIQFWSEEKMKWYFRTQMKMGVSSARMTARKLMNNIQLFLINKKARRKKPRKEIIALFQSISGYIKAESVKHSKDLYEIIDKC